MQREFAYSVDDEPVTVSIGKAGDQYWATIGERTYRVTARADDRGWLDLLVDGQRVRAFVAQAEDRRYVSLAGHTWALTKRDPRRLRRSRARASGASTLTATMPGLILDVLAAPGDRVRQGDTLVLMEAMKMELRITAPQDGVVCSVNCRAGEVVARGHQLIELEAGDHDE